MEGTHLACPAIDRSNGLHSNSPMASPPGNEGVWKILKFQGGDTGAKDTSSSCVTEGPFWQWKDCMCNGVVGVVARSRGGCV